MRILFALGNTNETGGWAAYARFIEREFSAQGVAVAKVAYTPGLLGTPPGLRHLIYLLRLIPKALRADAILAVDTWSTGFPAVLASILTGRPLVVRVGGDFLWEQYVERTSDLVPLSQFYGSAKKHFTFKEWWIYRGTKYLAHHAAVLAFNSAWQRDLWLKEYGIEQARTAVIENLFPARVAGEAPRVKNFVAAGRPIRLKNEALLRAVFTRVKQDYPDIALDTRSLPPEEHQERIRTCYAVVVASVSDVAPNAVLDAVKYGKPFIAPKDSGLTERLSGTGLFVDTKDPAALEGALRTLLDEGAYERVAEAVAGYDFVRTEAQVAGDFLQVFRRLCQAVR